MVTNDIRKIVPCQAFLSSLQGVFRINDPIRMAIQTPRAGKSKRKFVVIAPTRIMNTMNIFSQIGLIMLIGLVSKNGILMVEFANQRKLAGLDKFAAIRDSAASRFRPILMTSLSTILGILPMVFATGAGAESRISMGVAVAGGLIFSTFFTLYIIPAMYSYISSTKQ